MSDKSYVSLEQNVCLVCGHAYDTGSLLLDRRLHDSMDRYTVTGWGLCPEHLRLHEEGYVALVECDPEKSGNPRAGEKVMPQNAYRTGAVAHVKREIVSAVFNVPVSPDLPCMFVEPGFITKLQEMMQHPK